MRKYVRFKMVSKPFTAVLLVTVLAVWNLETIYYRPLTFHPIEYVPVYPAAYHRRTFKPQWGAESTAYTRPKRHFHSYAVCLLLTLTRIFCCLTNQSLCTVHCRSGFSNSKSKRITNSGTSLLTSIRLMFLPRHVRGPFPNYETW